MNAAARNRLFFTVQGALKYVAFESAVALRTAVYRPFFRSLGTGTRVLDGVTIKYPDRIDVGRGVTIGQQAFVNGYGGLAIGDDVMIGAGTKITTSEHVTDDLEVPMARQGLEGRLVVIESDVWLGFDVVITQGVTIGAGCIVGAGAVVTAGDYPPRSVLAGVPAKVIGSR